MSPFDCGSAQILGHLARQEDSCCLESLENGCLLAAVADGMGGAPAGDVASRTVTDCALQVFEAEQCPESAFKHLLTKARAQLSILEQEDESLRGLGSTLICVHIEPAGHLRWLNVGDSHLYLCRGRALRHISQNHNLGAVLEAQGGETQPGDHTLEPALYSHILMSAVTAQKPEIIDLRSEPFPLRTGDRLLLASDGIDQLTLDELRGLLMANGTAQEIAEGIVGAVTARGAAHQDNASVVVICV